MFDYFVFFMNTPLDVLLQSSFQKIRCPKTSAKTPKSFHSHFSPRRNATGHEETEVGKVEMNLTFKSGFCEEGSPVRTTDLRQWMNLFAEQQWRHRY